MMRPPALLAVGAVFLGATLLAGCTDSQPDPEAATTASSTPTTAAPAPPRPAPKAGECHRLNFTQASRLVDTTRSVPCRAAHTTVTYQVTPLDLVQDGHLLAVDSAGAKAQLAQTCAPGLRRWLGGSTEAMRLSRFSAVWFRPEVAQADLGAAWLRCDVVAVRSENRLARLKGDLRGVLDQDSALDTYGTCGTSAPGKKGFRRVICAEPHAWRARSTVDLPKDARYLGGKAGAAADDTCRERATSADATSLRVEWAFEWPTKEAWAEGRRYGMCWEPT